MPRGAEAFDRSIYAPDSYVASGLEVLEGEGLDRRERQAIDPAWKRAFRLFVLGAAVAASLGILRVQMTVLCVEKLSENAELKAQVHEAEEDARAYAVEGSVLGSAERIERIATQNLDMVYVGAGEPLGVREG